jgi:PHD/YefM family antitoxin component YafN of YafNO toxin-antitoxin module
MRRVSSAEFVRSFSAFSDAAPGEPIVLTRNGRDRLVVINIERYREILALATINAADDALGRSLAEEFRAMAKDEAPAPKRRRRR